MKNFKYVLDYDDYRTCRDFADAVYDTTAIEYARRGSSDVNKLKSDVEVGKAGEIAMYHYLTTIGKKATEVDFKIYGKKHKSFDADLTVGDTRFHVKCQDMKSVNKYGESFLMQRNDKILNAIGNNDKLVYCTFDGDLVEIKAIMNVSDLVGNGCIEETKVHQLRHTKVAVYMNTVRQKDINLWNLEENNGN